MEDRRWAALVVGIGNVLWADEGFGVRAVEALHDAYEFPEDVLLQDGGTQGLYLLDYVTAARRLIILDAVDYGLAPATLKVVRDADVPVWGATKMSLHQTGFHELLALAQLRGRCPESMLLIGVQPEDITDFGGSLRPAVKARLREAVTLAAAQLEAWGCAGVPRAAPPSPEQRLNARPLALDTYEALRPRAEAACRVGDARFLNRRRGLEKD